MVNAKGNSFLLKNYFWTDLVCLLLVFCVSVEGHERQVKSEIVEQLKGLNEDNRNTTLRQLVQYMQLQNVKVTQGVIDALANHTELKKGLILATLSDLAETESDEFAEKIKGLQLLFLLQPELLEVKLDEREGTPLQHAVELSFTNGEQFELVEMLIDNNANLNHRDHENSTVLHWAVQCNGSTHDVISIIKLLIQSGADPNAVNKWGQTFVHHAPCQTFPETFHEIVSYLDAIRNTKSFTMRDQAGAEVLHLAVFYYEYLGNDTLQIFKSIGVDFSARQNNNFNVIDCALSGTGNVTFLRNLVAFGAEFGKKDTGDHSLHWAAYFGNFPAVELFMSLGIQVHKFAQKGKTALYYALQGGQNATFIEKLIGVGAKWEMLSKDRREGGIHIAAWLGNLEAVKLFISLGADVNAVDTYGDTPLHYVFHPNSIIDENTFETIKQLSEEGANPNLRNVFDEKPVDLAKERKFEDKKLKRRVVNFLMRRMGR